MYSDVVKILDNNEVEQLRAENERLCKRLLEFDNIGYEPNRLKEIVKYAKNIARDSEPFEADKVFIHCDYLRGFLNRE